MAAYYERDGYATFKHEQFLESCRREGCEPTPKRFDQWLAWDGIPPHARQVIAGNLNRILTAVVDGLHRDVTREGGAQ